ncbi:hypothetical protein IMCC3317_24550 [Kordia antarctica]|uniref:Uncharacterized protein n=1 Tax=Kordia antarctica TaxID=1218801 RepID=A0A7L4ZKT0_9FLAO|nr:hypothetical protein IMCC3317_24550 [Kordia antarctica]
MTYCFTNAKTAYNIVLPEIKLTNLFKDTLYAQLSYDGIIITFFYLDSIIVNLNFYSTDNDKKIGFQNQSLKKIKL